MNKKELIIAAAAKSGLSQKDTAAALQALTTTIVSAVSKGDTVQLIGFGAFSKRERAARTARNPQTGESMKIAACAVPHFRVGKAFKDAVNVKPEPKKAAKKPAKKKK